MRTIFVNPSPSMMNPRRRRRRSNITLANPRRKKRRARSQIYRTVRAPAKFYVRKNRRRRNAGIAPFVNSNPLIMDNPRRRRRRRSRNPDFSPKSMLSNVLLYGGGSAMGAALNILGLRRIENDWLRNGARIAAAIAGGVLIKGSMGAAMAGATLYPTFAELALMTNLISGGSNIQDTDADLNELAADLQDVLDEIEDDEDDDLLYVP